MVDVTWDMLMSDDGDGGGRKIGRDASPREANCHTCPTTLQRVEKRCPLRIFLPPLLARKPPGNNPPSTTRKKKAIPTHFLRDLLVDSALLNPSTEVGLAATKNIFEGAAPSSVGL